MIFISKKTIEDVTIEKESVLKLVAASFGPGFSENAFDFFSANLL